MKEGRKRKKFLTPKSDFLLSVTLKESFLSFHFSEEVALRLLSMRAGLASLSLFISL